MSTRTEQGAIAWAVSLNTFPYFSVPAYWVFGRNKFEGYTAARGGQDYEELIGLSQAAVDHAQQFRVTNDLTSAGRVAEALGKFRYLKGNSVELLVDGDATFASILDGIDRAQEYILFQFYIVHDDVIGQQIKNRLIERARDGIRISFLFDEIGSMDLSDEYQQDLRDAGVAVLAFNTQKGFTNKFQLNFRNHRKIMVIDGKEAWIGGHNIGDEYLGRDPEFGHWRDTHTRIEGPAALGGQVSFAEDWLWASGEQLELNWVAEASSGADVPVLILPTGPADELETANLMFVHAINTAKKRIWIASPYYVPDRPIIDALQLAGLKGVDVRILIPDKPDSLGVELAAYNYLDEAGLTGVKFYRYLDGFLHEKVMLIDDYLTSIGTANFDNRSFRLNFEVTAVIADREFAREAETMFEADFAKSRLMEPDEYSRKPWWFRFGVRLARLTSPVL
jgi:cardiolipin synthase